MLFSLANLPYWIFLALGILLFLLVIFTGGGDDGVDVDVDADLDLDADTDADFSLGNLLGWLGFGKAPLILLLATDLSLIGSIGWILNVLAGETLGQIPGGFWAGIILVLTSAIALFLGSLIARPLGQVFAQFGEDAGSDRLIGCIGTVSSAVIPARLDGRIGQVDVIDSARNLVTVNTVLPEWATVMPRRGEKVLVIDRLPNYYLVIAKDSVDQESWLNSSPRPSR
jgi:hypothetical protein